MLLSWFPPRRHRWFDVLCCPPNLARMFATVDQHVAAVDADGDLRVHLPVAARIRGAGWDVEVRGDYPEDGRVEVLVHAQPAGRRVRVRIPGWAGGAGHRPLPADGRVELRVDWQWWETDRRVEGGGHAVHLRRGPVVHCVEGIDLPGVDLRDLVVDPGRGPEDAFARLLDPGRNVGGDASSAGPGLHRPAGDRPVAPVPEVPTLPYHRWANRGPTTMRLRFPRAPGSG